MDLLCLYKLYILCESKIHMDIHKRERERERGRKTREDKIKVKWIVRSTLLNALVTNILEWSAWISTGIEESCVHWWTSPRERKRSKVDYHPSLTCRDGTLNRFMLLKLWLSFSFKCNSELFEVSIFFKRFFDEIGLKENVRLRRFLALYKPLERLLKVEPMFSIRLCAEISTFAKHCPRSSIH